MINKNKLKTYIAGLTAAIMLCSTAAFAANTSKTVTAVYNNIKIVVDGSKVTPKDVNGNIVEPFIIDGTTYLPVRALANALGQGVDWDPETSTVIIGGEADTPVATLPTTESEGKGYASVEVTAVYNDIKIKVDGAEVTPKDVNGNIVEPFIIDGTTYLPVRALANALGQEVDWDQVTSTVYIGEKPYRVNSSILKQYANETLATVGSMALKGAYYNVYMSQTGNSATFPYYCDNFSNDKDLQTMTIGSVPAAKALTEAITSDLVPIFAVYESAVKNNFTARADIAAAIEDIWNSYRNQFDTDAEYNAFLEECGITAEQYEEFVRITSVASLFGDDLYSRYMQVPYTEDEIMDLCKESYVTAKHILVADEETAKNVITKLKSGSSFDKLAEEYNLDPGYTTAGYTFTYGEMVQEFEEASFSLKENTYTTTPVKSAYGYHVILRLPLDTAWISSNITTIQASMATKDTNAVINQIVSETTVSFTDAYNSYISTIK